MDKKADIVFFGHIPCGTGSIENGGANGYLMGMQRERLRSMEWVNIKVDGVEQIMIKTSSSQNS